MSAQETTAALQETTAELQDLKGELKWLKLHTKREHELARDPKRFRRELIVCAVVAVGATLLTLVTMLVLGTIIREMVINTIDNLRGWWGPGMQFFHEPLTPLELSGDFGSASTWQDRITVTHGGNGGYIL